MDESGDDAEPGELLELEPLIGPAVLLPLSDAERLRVVYIEGVVLEPPEDECPLVMLLLKDPEAGEAPEEFEDDGEAAECLVFFVEEEFPPALLVV
jgi:hypothetical protein